MMVTAKKDRFHSTGSKLINRSFLSRKNTENITIKLFKNRKFFKFLENSKNTGKATW